MNAWWFLVTLIVVANGQLVLLYNDMQLRRQQAHREATPGDLTSSTNPNLHSGPDSAHSGPSRRLNFEVEDDKEEVEAVDDRLDPATTEAIAKCDSQLKAAHPEVLLNSQLYGPLFMPLVNTPFLPLQTQVLGVLLAIDHTQANTILPYFMKRLTNVLWQQGVPFRVFGAELADHQMGLVNRGFLLNIAALHAIQTRAIDYFAIFDIQRLILPGSNYRFIESLKFKLLAEDRSSFMTSSTGFDSLVFKGALMVHTSLFVSVNGYSLGYRGAAHPWADDDFVHRIRRMYCADHHPGQEVSGKRTGSDCQTKAFTEAFVTLGSFAAFDCGETVNIAPPQRGLTNEDRAMSADRLDRNDGRQVDGLELVAQLPWRHLSTASGSPADSAYTAIVVDAPVAFLRAVANIRPGRNMSALSSSWAWSNVQHSIQAAWRQEPSKSH